MNEKQNSRAAAPQAPAAPTAAAAVPAHGTPWRLPDDLVPADGVGVRVFAETRSGQQIFCTRRSDEWQSSNGVHTYDVVRWMSEGDLRSTLSSFAAPTQAPAAGAAPTDAFWWRKRADEIELAVAHSGSTEAMRYYTDMRTLLQAVSLRAAAPAQEAAPLTYAELQEVKRAADDIEDCGETDVDHDLLLRAAMAGYLECARFRVLDQSALDRAAARARQEGGA